MTMIEILHQDYVRNHTDRASFAQCLEELLRRITEGYTLSRFAKTIIIHKFIGAQGEGIEFHCYNAGSAAELTEAVLKFLSWAEGAGSTWAETPYQNPRITQLFRAAIEPEQLSIIDTPTGFEATIRL